MSSPHSARPFADFREFTFGRRPVYRGSHAENQGLLPLCRRQALLYDHLSACEDLLVAGRLQEGLPWIQIVGVAHGLLHLNGELDGLPAVPPVPWPMGRRDKNWLGGGKTGTAGANRPVGGRAIAPNGAATWVSGAIWHDRDERHMNACWSARGLRHVADTLPREDPRWAQRPHH